MSETTKAMVQAYALSNKTQVVTKGELEQVWRELNAYETTDSPLTTLGDIIVAQSGGVPGRLGIGSAGQLLRVNGGGTLEYFTQTFSTGLTATETSPTETTIMNDLITGVSGGQAVTGGTDAGNDLTLRSNLIFDGRINFGNAGASYIDEPTGNLILGGSITTADPGDGTAAVRLGAVVNGAVTPDATRYASCTWNGVSVKLIIGED